MLANAHKSDQCLDASQLPLPCGCVDAPFACVLQIQYPSQQLLQDVSCCVLNVRDDVFACFALLELS